MADRQFDLGDIKKFQENFDPEPLPWMGARIRKGLMKLGVETYGKLAALTSSEVLATKPGLGQTSLVRMRNVLATRGLCFRDESAMTGRLTRIGEIERLRNLKGVLMELGNRLVTDHGWEPVAGAGARTCGQTRDHTGLVAGLTKQINDSPAMREVLTALGFDWPIIEKEVSDV